MRLIRGLIAACIGIYWSALGSFCAAVEIKFVTHDGANVIYQLSQDRIFLSIIEKIYFKQYTHADALLALENEDTKVEIHQLFSELLQETQGSSFAPVLSNIADPALQQQVITYVQQTHQTFHKKSNGSSKLLVEDYIAAANRWCGCHATSAYLDLLVTLYGQTHLEGATCIYVHPFLTDQPDAAIQVDNSPCVLEILDTAGTEQFASMRDLYIKNGHGFIVMYSLTNHQTFQDISNMKNVISRVKGSQPAPILLVANKLDLECQREVSHAEGNALAELWECPFIEASAKDRINVNEVFARIVREMNMTSEKRQNKNYCCCTLL